MSDRGSRYQSRSGTPVSGTFDPEQILRGSRNPSRNPSRQPTPVGSRTGSPSGQQQSISSHPSRNPSCIPSRRQSPVGGLHTPPASSAQPQLRTDLICVNWSHQFDIDRLRDCHLDLNRRKWYLCTEQPCPNRRNRISAPKEALLVGNYRDCDDHNEEVVRGNVLQTTVPEPQPLVFPPAGTSASQEETVEEDIELVE